MRVAASSAGGDAASFWGCGARPPVSVLTARDGQLSTPKPRRGLVLYGRDHEEAQLPATVAATGFGSAVRTVSGPGSVAGTELDRTAVLRPHLGMSQKICAELRSRQRHTMDFQGDVGKLMK